MERPRKTERERSMWRDFTKALQEVWRESGEPCSSYRPDLHYMRGPGPKWREKRVLVSSGRFSRTAGSGMLHRVLRECAATHDRV